MEFNYNETLPIHNNRNAVDIVTSNLIKSRRNVELEEETIYDDSHAEVILRYTGHPETQCERRHIVLSGENDQITINAIASSQEKAAGLKVGIKGTARNIRSSVATRADSEKI